ncbi:uncharacterized protein LOC134230659 [Saccostrea cucullata]|uniref:uncharacterized protein LOC134230659 n=1 Tax=Saccostrea cuccullata TaxID=36930 RepID=UPI002ED344D2
MPPTILKRRHDLRNKNVTLKLMKKFKDLKVSQRMEYARFKSNERIEEMSVEDLRRHLKNLLDDDADLLLDLAGAPVCEDSLRKLAHVAILLANEIGQPQGHDLQDKEDTEEEDDEQGPSTSKRKRTTLKQRIENLEKVKEDTVKDLKEKGVVEIHNLPPLSAPEWEMNVNFNPFAALKDVRTHPTWVTLNKDKPTPAVRSNPSKDLKNSIPTNLGSLPLRDPDNFVAGGLNACKDEWLKLPKHLPENVVRWISEGVNVQDFFQTFKGNFKGKAYNSAEPPRAFFNNSTTCKNYLEFISREILNRLQSGSIRLWGKLGECELPKVVMPLTIEPSKPRLCHDERYLNLWIKDCPFQLENLKHVPRLVEKDVLMVACDEKSGCDHVRLTQGSETYFGFQFGGWVFTYSVIPFGWKASAFVYQTIGMQVTTFLRELGIITLQYIDDRLLVASNRMGSFESDISKVSFEMLELLTRLGYTLSLKKSRLFPSTELKFLGFIVDSAKQAFILPCDKKHSFITLRNHILNSETVDVKTLQKFAGKCVSMNLVVPAARLYCREVNAAISRGLKNSRLIPITGDLKREIEHWNFIDNWDTYVPWRRELHKQITLATDASLFKYGVSVMSAEQETLTFGDFWDSNDKRPIHLKEAEALIKALQSLDSAVHNHRVDIMTDNTSVIAAWENQGARNKPLNDIMKSLFTLTYNHNIDLHLTYIASNQNKADAPSRSISLTDSKLSDKSWALVEMAFGPHTVDLMSLDSNAMKTPEGVPLRHFTPSPSPFSAGVNVFAQDIIKEENPYVNPPFNIILPLLKFLKDQHAEVINLEQIDERLSTLHNQNINSPHQKKKSSLAST